MTVEKLQNDTSFQLLLMLRHEEVLPFVQEQFMSPTLTIRFYMLLNLSILIGVVVLAVINVGNSVVGIGKLLSNFTLGILLVITVLIPLHEGIHGLAYKLVGAPSVSYGVNWRKFYFYAVANRFVVNRNAFIFIGLAPFFTINTLTVAAIYFAGPEIKWLLLGVLLMHTGACAGDFAMLSFYEKYWACREMLTFDDVEKKVSFFYVKEP